jgi:hypothetical protein
MGLFLDFEKKQISLVIDFQSLVNLRMGLFRNFDLLTHGHDGLSVENLRFRCGVAAAAVQEASDVARNDFLIVIRAFYHGRGESYS